MMLYTQEVPQSIEELDAKIRLYTEEISLLPKFPGYSMYTTFSHLFDGGYAAGYYSYMWSEIIEAQVWDVFQKNGVLSPEI
jgi:peptidyl-dipeptidase Dcp